MKTIQLFSIVGFIAMLFVCPFTMAAGPDAVVYTSPTVLPANTVLSDGGYMNFPAFTDDTLVIWVDPHPGMKFTHETYYIFISADGTISIEEGGWWPELMGSVYMYGQDPWMTKFPVYLFNSNSNTYPAVKIYANPFLICPADVISDGGSDGSIDDYALLYWIDLNPLAKFAHQTAYLIIPAEGKPFIKEGQWWPELNDDMILYGQPDTYLRFPYPINNANWINRQAFRKKGVVPQARVRGGSNGT